MLHDRNLKNLIHATAETEPAPKYLLLANENPTVLHAS